MNRAESPHSGKVLDGHVSPERGGICHDHVIANMAVVSNMRVSHDQVVATHGSQAPAFHGPTVDGYEFADRVVIPNLQPGRLSLVGDVLRRKADRGERGNRVVGTYLCGTFHRDVGDQPAIVTDLDVRSDDAIRTNVGGGMKLGL